MRDDGRFWLNDECFYIECARNSRACDGSLDYGGNLSRKIILDLMVVLKIRPVRLPLSKAMQKTETLDGNPLLASQNSDLPSHFITPGTFLSTVDGSNPGG